MGFGLRVTQTTLSQTERKKERDGEREVYQASKRANERASKGHRERECVTGMERRTSENCHGHCSLQVGQWAASSSTACAIKPSAQLGTKSSFFCTTVSTVPKIKET